MTSVTDLEFGRRLTEVGMKIYSCGPEQFIYGLMSAVLQTK